jgi:hypothetical protein
MISIGGGLIAACALLLSETGCGSGSTTATPTPSQTSSEASTRADSKTGESEAMAGDQEPGGSNGGQATADEGDVVKIPLDQIWALHQPGTKDILELDQGGDERSLLKLPKDEIERRWKESPTRQIAESLSADTPGSDWPKEGEKAKPGFAVRGTGVDALKEACEVLVKHKAVNDSFPQASPLSLVFFSYEMGGYAELLAVKRSGNVIEMRYRLTGEPGKGLAVGFELVPIGPLPSGEYQVSMIRMPSAVEFPRGTRIPVPENEARKKWDSELAERFVCKPFKFSVRTGNSN